MSSFPLCSHVVVLFLTFSISLASLELNCCSEATGSCRSSCEQLSFSNFAADNQARLERVRDLENVCTPQLIPFWKCINETLEEINKGSNWQWRPCCPLTQSEKCKEACMTGTSRTDLLASCRQSDELAFFTCLDRQKVGSECCSNAWNRECEGACRAVFRSNLTPSREVRIAVSDACSDNSPKVIHCVKNFTRVAPVTNPHTYLHCCEKSTHKTCQETCRRILRMKNTDQEIIDSLQEGGCGPPLLHDKLWQCFLQGSENKGSTVGRTGLDAAKLHCCYRAVTPACKRLCLQTFTTNWTQSWFIFDKECSSHPSEESLSQCLDEIEEPCELGCEGLSYCTNFNNRPTELFRSCSVQADDAARYDVALWQQQGTFVLPSGLQLTVKNISGCSPQAWKAVACTLQIKPCQRGSHVNTICRQDCYELLSRCLDWSRMPAGHSAASVCNQLSPKNTSDPCVSLQPFLEPSDSPYLSPLDQLTTPCRGDPCPPGEVCSINRNCRHGHHCSSQQFTCSPGCKLGEVSQFIVPEGSYARIPLADGLKGCLKICRCMRNSIEKCQPMPCFPLDPCWLGREQIVHGGRFFMECNVCSCYAGEITCTKKQCDIPALGHDYAYTSLPCNCAPHYVPVCGRNGKTYPNSCLAKCAGLTDSDFEFGQCESKNPCEPNPCSEAEMCIPARQVCLSLLHKPCQQYQCINIRETCSSLPREPVCDTEGREHPNSCFLARYGKTLAYRGPCLNRCNKSGMVCGIDANTYASECAAQAQYVSVDYRGPCTSIGLVSSRRCALVTCRPLSISDCIGVIPPGACCPICAGGLSILYSQKQVDRALYALRGAAMGSLTVTAVVRALDRLIQVAECTARGHLTIELDLIVLVVPVSQSPSPLQLDACVREAEKLASLIHRGSPRVLSELSLSALIAATVVHSQVTSLGDSVLFSSSKTFLIFAILIYFFNFQSHHVFYHF